MTNRAGVIYKWMKINLQKLLLVLESLWGYDQKVEERGPVLM